MKYIAKFYIDARLDDEAVADSNKKIQKIIDAWEDKQDKNLQKGHFEKIGMAYGSRVGVEYHCFINKDTYISTALVIERTVDLEKRDHDGNPLFVGDSIIPDWAVGCNGTVKNVAKYKLVEENDSTIWLCDSNGSSRLNIDMVDLGKFYKLTDR